MSDAPVALIIAAKDASATIGQAVATALLQPEAAEVVVVDDGSRDETGQVARNADDGSGRLSIIRLERNLGPSAARNRAIAASTAPLLGVLDADDYLEPDRLARLLAQAPPRWDLLADNMAFRPVDRPEAPSDLLVALDPPAPLRLDADAFVRGNFTDPARPRRELGFLKPLIRRGFLTDHHVAYDEALRLGEDFVLYTEMLLKGASFWLTGYCGYIAIERPLSLSGVHGGADLAALAAADDRLLSLAARRPGDLQALRTHRHATRLRRDYALMLEAKRDGRYGAAIRSLLRTPATTAHILSATARARLARLAR